MAGGNRIDFTVGFTVDKKGLTDITKSINEVEQELNKLADENINGLGSQFAEAANQADKLQVALSGAWSDKLNQLDLSKLNNSITSIYGSVSNMKTSFEQAGTTGTTAFNKLSSSILSTNLEIKESNKFLNEMADTFAKTAKWTVASTAIRELTSEVQKAWSFTKELDTSLNNIRIVTQYSADQMADFAVQANNAAKALGTSTTEYTNASLIFYQQGLGDEESNARTETVLKVANVTGQAAEEVADNLTAVWNGYQVTADQAEASIDILSAVAANTASNLEELTTGMSKVASAANEMGVGEAQLASQISTIVSATRQAPETVGQALKTVYARMSTINAGGEDEDDGATLASYSEKMNQFGINVLDANGHLRDMGDVIEEIGGKWDTFSRETQVSLAQAMGGTRQYVNVMALFENWDQYEKTLDIANNSLGTLQQQQDTYMESTAAHLEQLGASMETIYNNLFDTSVINKMIDALTKVVDLVGVFINSLGGGMQSFANLGLLIANIFSNQIGNAISKQVDQMQQMRRNEASLSLVQETASSMSPQSDAYGAQAQRATDLLNIVDDLSQEEYNRLTNLNTEITQLDLQIERMRALGDNDAEWLASQGEIKQEIDEINSALVMVQTNQKNIGTETLKVTQLTKEQEEAIIEETKLTKEQNATVSVMSATGRENLEQQYKIKNAQEEIERQNNILKKQAGDLVQEEQNLVNKYQEQYPQLKEIEQARININEKISQEVDAGSDVTEQYKERVDIVNAEREALQEVLTLEKQRQMQSLDDIQAALNGGIDTATLQAASKQLEYYSDINAQERAAALGELTKGFTGLAVGVQQCINVFQTLRSSDLTPWEKASQVFTQLLMTVPQLTRGISGLAEGLPKLAKTIQDNVKLGNLHNTVLAATEKQMKKEAAAAGEAAVAEEVVGTAGQTAGAKTSIGFMEATASVLTFETALGPVWAILLAIAAAGAAIGGIVAVVRNVQKSYDELANSAQAASEAADELAQSHDDLVTKIDNLESAIEAYDSAQEALDGCTQGTEEWKEQLKETNQEAITLLETISAFDLANSGVDISSLYTRNENGVIVIDEDELQKLLDYENQQEAVSQMTASGESAQAEILKAESDFLDKVVNVVSNSLAPDTFTPVGASAKTADWDYSTGKEMTDYIIENAGTVTDLTSAWDLASKAMIQFGLTTDQGSDTFKTFVQGILDCANQVNNAEGQFKAISDLEISSLLPDESGAIQEIVSQETVDLTNKLAQDWEDFLESGKNPSGLLQEYVDEIDKDSKINRWTGSDDEIYQMLLNALNAAGMEVTEANNPVRRENGQLTYYFNNGEEDEDYKITEIAAILSTSEAMGNLENTVEQASNSLLDFKEYLSKEEFDALQEFLATGTLENISSDVVNSLLATFQDSDLQESLSSIGIDLSVFQAAVSEYNDGIDSLTDNLTGTAKAVFENLDTDSLSLTQGGYLSNLLEDVYTEIGASALSGLTSVLNEFNDSENTDNLNEFVDVLQSLDESWGTVSVQDFKDALEKADITTDLTEDQLYYFVAAMNSVGEATLEAAEDLESFGEQLTSLSGIVDGLSRNDTISDEDYQTLISNVGAEISQYFVTMWDGTHKLIKDADEFRDIVYKTALDNQLATIESNYEKLNNFIEAMNTPDASGNYTNWDFYDQSANNLSKSTSTNYFGPANDVDVNGNPINVFKSESGLDATSLKDFIQDQISLIETYYEATGALDDYTDQIADWNKAINSGNYEEVADDIAEEVSAIRDVCDSAESATEVQDEYNAQIREFYDCNAAACTSLSELDMALDAGYIDLEAYALMFDSLWQEQRVEDLNEQEIEDYTAYLEMLARSAAELSTAIDDVDSYIAQNQKVFKNWAIELLNMNDAIEDLADNLEDYEAALKDTNKLNSDTSAAFTSLNKDLQKLLNTSQDFSLDFINENLEDLKLAAEGDADAIERLRASALDAVILDIETNIDDFSGTCESFGLQCESMADYAQQLKAELDSQDWTVSPSLDPTDFEGGADSFIGSLNDLIDATGMTSAQVQQMLADMGYDVEFEDQEVEETTEIPVYQVSHKVHQVGTSTMTYIDPSTGEERTYDVPEWIEETKTTQVGTEPATGTAIVSSSEVSTGGGYSGGGDSSVRHVKSISKSATSSGNKYATSTPSSTGSSGSGSSGGGSGSSSEPKTKDLLENEIDRYHDINIRLQDISTSLSRLQKQESKLFGSNLIDNWNEQLATLDDYIDATRVKMEIMQEEQAEIQEELIAEGIEFDANGRISNYADVLEAKLDYVNAAIEKYNAMSAEEQEAYEDELQTIIDGYDELVSRIADYDTLITESWPELQDQLQDLLDQEIQLQISKFTMAIEIRLDMKEVEENYNSFLRRFVEGYSTDDLRGDVYEDYHNLLDYFENSYGDGSGSSLLEMLMKQVEDTQAEFDKMANGEWSEIYGDNMTQVMEDLQNYTSELIDAMMDIDDLVTAIWEDYLDGIDQAIDAFDDLMAQYEFLNDHLEHEINLISLLYGDQAYGMLQTYYQQQYDNNIAQMKDLQEQAALYQKMMDAATDQDEYNKIRDAYQEVIRSCEDLLEDTIETARDKLEAAVNEVIAEFNDSITNGIGLDLTNAEWDLMNKEADLYLDTINSIYEVNKLQQQYLDAIDNTDSISAQQKLNDLMEEEIGYLTEKENLTQYDIDRAQLQYEIALKQIALEEAQQNKSTLRLRRDANGNYTYQYVADEDEIGNLRNELLELENQLYNLDVDQYKSLMNTYLNEIANFEQMWYDSYTYYLQAGYDQEEAKAKATEDLLDEYSEYLQNIAKEIEVAGNNVTDSLWENMAWYCESSPELVAAMISDELNSYLGLEEAVTNGTAVTHDYILEKINEIPDDTRTMIEKQLLPMLDTAAAEMIEYTTQVTYDNTTIWEKGLQEAMDSTAAAYQEWQELVSAAMDAAGESIEDVRAGTSALTDETTGWINSAKEASSTANDLALSLADLAHYMDEAREAALENADANQAWAQAIRAVISAQEALLAYENSQATAAETEHDTMVSGGSSSGEATIDTGSSSESGSSSSVDPSSMIGKKVTLDPDTIWYHDSAGSDPHGYYKSFPEAVNNTYLLGIASSTTATHPYALGGAVTEADKTTGNSWYKDGIFYNASQLWGFVKKSDIKSFDTGGYIGEDSGLALLHEKEMVLNKDDTSNILTAVSTVRDASGLIESLKGDLINKLTQMKIKCALSMIDFDKENDVLDQNVHIEANFPSVNSSYEIEQALSNLVNVASQYVHNTNR